MRKTKPPKYKMGSEILVSAGMQYRRSWFYVERDGKRLATFWIHDLADEGEARLHAVLFIRALKAEAEREARSHKPARRRAAK